MKDKTGNRRFFPIHCEKSRQIKSVSEWINDADFDAELDQVWAEAFEAWNKGESLWIGEEMEKIAQVIQEQHTKPDPLVGMIETFLAKKIPSDWYETDIQRRIEFCQNLGDFDVDEQEKYLPRNKICVMEIWAELMNGDLKKLTQHKQQEIFDALLKIQDWEEYKNYGEKLNFGSAYGQQKAFVRKKADKNFSASKAESNFENEKADEFDENNLPF